MPTNQVPLWVYKINQRKDIPLTDVTQISFPAQGVILRDCFNSPTRALTTGVNVYSAIQDASGNLYYVMQTISQLVTLFNS